MQILTSSAVNLSAWFIRSLLNLKQNDTKYINSLLKSTVKYSIVLYTYSSLLTTPVAFGSKSLKAARMVSSGSVPVLDITKL